MDRILRGTAATITIQFAVNETDTDPSPDAATIEIVRDNGTVLVNAGTSTAPGSGDPAQAGLFTYTLTPTQTLLLDRLTARWTAMISGYEQTLETQVEIVGGFLCSLQQIGDSLDRGGSKTDYSLRLKQQARTVAETAIEQACGQAFTSRYGSGTFDGTGSTDLLLPTPYVSTVRSVTVDGTALGPTDLAGVITYPSDGVLYRSTGWGNGRRNTVIAWEHGQNPTPADVSRATALWAAYMLANGPWDDRGYGVTDDQGAIRLLTAGVSGAWASIPDVESVIQRYRHPSIA